MKNRVAFIFRFFWKEHGANALCVRRDFLIRISQLTRSTPYTMIWANLGLLKRGCGLNEQVVPQNRHPAREFCGTTPEIASLSRKTGLQRVLFVGQSSILPRRPTKSPFHTYFLRNNARICLVVPQNRPPTRTFCGTTPEFACLSHKIAHPHVLSAEQCPKLPCRPATRNRQALDPAYIKPPTPCS